MEHDKFPVPLLTFGVELELCFIVKRSLFYSWLQEEDPGPGNRPPSDDGNSVSSDPYPTGPKDPPEYMYTTSSNHPAIQHKLRNYIVAFLNRELPSSPRTPSRLGKVVYTAEDTSQHSTWQLTVDYSVMPSRQQLADQRGLQIQEVKDTLHVTGAELVSPVFSFEDEEHWKRSLEQIYTDLAWDGNHGIWLNGSEGLHVHFATSGEEIPLPTLKNVMALYGLYEREIEKWHHVSRRGCPGALKSNRSWCKSIRLGMEQSHRLDLLADNVPSLIKYGRKYTPQEFTERIYATKDYLALGEEVFGRQTPSDEAREIYGMENILAEYATAKYVTVHISEPTGSKPITLEFRHAEATLQVQDIIWWAKFCAYLVRYAETLEMCSTKVVDEGNVGSDISFVENLAATSILELISFPREGIVHFEDMAIKKNSPACNALRRVEEHLIQHRIRWRAKGNVMDKAAEAVLRQNRGFIAANARLQDRYGVMIEDDEWEWFEGDQIGYVQGSSDWEMV